jgi:hypothetical protein
MQLTCLYVPDAPTHLLPPQQLSDHKNASQANGSWIGFGEHALVFYEGHCIRFPYHEASNLPIAKLAPESTKYQAFLVLPMPPRALLPNAMTTSLPPPVSYFVFTIG